MKNKFLIISLAMGSLCFSQNTCIGKTKSGENCKLKIKSTNTTMLCHHHIKKTYNAGDTIWVRASVVCNAKTKKETNCKLKTKHWSGKCHHHRD
tara:strand:- start:350 stop:631 length:282 start_codon:yes stop_codon:yes gene_type:complete